MRAIKFLLLTLMLGICTPTQASEVIISKVDADLVFSMKRIEWEAYAPRVADRKWKIRIKRIETGAGVMAFDPATGMGLSVQPFYINDTSPPDMLIVGSFYPNGKFPSNLSKFVSDIEKAAQNDLGGLYEVTARYVKLPPSWEGVEITVTQSKNAPQ